MGPLIGHKLAEAGVSGGASGAHRKDFQKSARRGAESGVLIGSMQGLFRKRRAPETRRVGSLAGVSIGGRRTWKRQTPHPSSRRPKRITKARISGERAVLIDRYTLKLRLRAALEVRMKRAAALLLSVSQHQIGRFGVWRHSITTIHRPAMSASDAKVLSTEPLVSTDKTRFMYLALIAAR